MIGMETYRDHLYGLGFKPSTVRNYELRVRQASEWCREHETNLYDITATNIAAMLPTWPRTASVLSQVRAALKHYWTMAGRADPPVAAIPLPPPPRGVCRAVSPEHARALVKTALGWRPEGLAVLAGLYLALRATEIASMRWDRIDDGWYTVTGKNSVTATLPIHPILESELASHRRRREWVFPGRLDGHVTSQTIWNWTQLVAGEAGVGRIRVHDLRHTAIAEVHDRTGDLRAASVFARHAKIQTTERYTRTTAKKLIESVLALDYLT